MSSFGDSYQRYSASNDNWKIAISSLLKQTERNLEKNVAYLQPSVISRKPANSGNSLPSSISTVLLRSSGSKEQESTVIPPNHTNTVPPSISIGERPATTAVNDQSETSQRTENVRLSKF